MNSVLSGPKVFVLCSSVGCLPKLQEPRKTEEPATERTVIRQAQSCPLPKYHLGSQGGGTMQSYTFSNSLISVRYSETFNPEIFRLLAKQGNPR